jgi:L-lactate dehydrogenase complex protein LldG
VKFEVTRELAARAKFGISQMEWALADTGSLAQNSTAIEQRLVSSLSTIHIALVPTGGILPDMPSLLSRVNPKESAYIAMITGASRTADIERVLTIGVHGPERLIIVFVDELGGEV